MKYFIDSEKPLDQAPATPLGTWVELQWRHAPDRCPIAFRLTSGILLLPDEDEECLGDTSWQDRYCHADGGPSFDTGIEWCTSGQGRIYEEAFKGKKRVLKYSGRMRPGAGNTYRMGKPEELRGR